MISAEDKDNIIKCAEKYNVSSIILFGSSVEKDKESNDIDIGVKGIEPRLFFPSGRSFMDELIMSGH